MGKLRHGAAEELSGNKGKGRASLCVCRRPQGPARKRRASADLLTKGRIIHEETACIAGRRRPAGADHGLPAGEHHRRREKPPEKEKPPKETPKTETTTKGAITKVDAERKLVTVRFEDVKQMTFNVGADTKITLDTKEATIADLKDGQAVTVKAKGADASTIDAKPVAPVTVTPPPATPTTVKGKAKSAAGDKVTVAASSRTAVSRAQDCPTVGVDAADSHQWPRVRRLAPLTWPSPPRSAVCRPHAVVTLRRTSSAPPLQKPLLIS